MFCAPPLFTKARRSSKFYRTATSSMMAHGTASPRKKRAASTSSCWNMASLWSSAKIKTNGFTEADLVVHDAHHPRPSYAFLLSHMEHRPGFPTPIGVFRAWDDLPRYEDVINEQVREVISRKGPGDLNRLLQAGDTWEVK